MKIDSSPSCILKIFELGTKKGLLLVSFSLTPVSGKSSSYEHKLALSKPIQDEWLKHRTEHGENYSPYASRYALQWFYKMMSERRVIWIEVDDHRKIVDQILALAAEQDRGQIRKDIHLVVTALVSDKRVIASDDKIRKHFRNIGMTLKLLCEILWLNPLTMPTQEWLCDGAPDDASYLLCQE